MRLAINIDHVATLREARGGNEPDLVEAARVCELAGAKGIVCHLREDRRHIHDRDVRSLRENITTKFDLEMAATVEIIRIAIETRPELVTLVPERREELTTEGGLDVRGQMSHLRGVLGEFHRHGIEVSLFIDPIPEQIEAAREVGADKIEIHTGEYSNARSERETQVQLETIRRAARMGRDFGLGVNAGHGLNYTNIEPIRTIPEIEEVSIGHAIISRALFIGLDKAVREMARLTQ